MRILPLALAAVVVIGSPVHASVPASVQRWEDRWAADFNESRLDALAENYDKDAVLTLPGEPPVEGRRAIRQALRTMAHDVTGLSLTTTSVRPLGRAVLLERGVGRFADPSDPTRTELSSYQVTWRRTPSGRWLICRDVVTSRVVPIHKRKAAAATRISP